MIRFACGACRTVLQVNDDQAGQTIRCGKCRQPLRVPPPTRPQTPLGAVMPPPVPAHPDGDDAVAEGTAPAPPRSLVPALAALLALCVGLAALPIGLYLRQPLAAAGLNGR
jgi:hypothetical protein